MDRSVDPPWFGSTLNSPLVTDATVMVDLFRSEPRTDDDRGIYIQIQCPTSFGNHEPRTTNQELFTHETITPNPSTT